MLGQAGPDLSPRFLPPAEVARSLAAGDLDIGLIPSIEVKRIPGLKVLPGLCVAATREVRSVLLLSRCPIREIERLALDENSRTSAALVRILLRERFGIEPHCQTASPSLGEMMEQADAALIIGDPALTVDRTGLHVLDLAAEWRDLTGHPFVFAVWAVRSHVDPGPWQEVFHASLRRGRAEMEILVKEASEEMGLDVDVVREYLTECLSFELGPAEQLGLTEFYRRAYAQGLLDRLQEIDGLEFLQPRH